MIKFDDELLSELKLAGLPESHRRAVLDIMNEELEIRVGMRLARAMTDEQLAAFEVFINRSDQAGGLVWIAENIPNYSDAVREEFDTLCKEIAVYSQDIRDLSAANAGIEVRAVIRESPWSKDKAPADQTPTPPAGQTIV